MAVEIRPVASRRDLNTFIKLPWRLYRNEPNWVAPLLSDLKEQLDPRRNPFFEHAEAQYFLAFRDGRAVGRVSAHIDRNMQEFQGNDWGLWGWFECENDPEAARALLAAAEHWLRAHGAGTMIGPMSFTTNDECGLMVEGHGRRPIILNPWHHAYYQALLEDDMGLSKVMDLYMWSLDVSGRDKVHPAIWEMARKVESEHGIVCRNFSKKDLHEEVGRFLEVYNAAWERNWGFVPLSEREVRHYAKKLKPILDENWAMVAEKADTGEVVGAALSLPDYNQVLAKLRPRGRLFPFGWLTALRERSKIDAGVRVRARREARLPAHRHRRALL